MEPASASPGISELIEIAIDRVLMDVHTSAPGTIVSYNPSTQIATVQPSFQRNIGGTLYTLPEIADVPVCFPRTKTAWLKFPLQAGDNVQLHFMERSLDAWLQNGGTVDPGMPRKFSLSDCVAVPGLEPISDAFTANTPATSLELALGESFFEINEAGLIRVKNPATDLLTVLKSVLNHLIGLSTINCVVGSPVTLSPATILQLNQDIANLSALLTS
jgi:hypothetical protein